MPPKRRLSLFETDLGWIGMIGCGNVLESLVFGDESSAMTLQRLKAAELDDCEIRDWNAGLKKRLARFAKTGEGDFADVKTVLTETTPFAQRVIQVVRGIGLGETLSYSEVAEAAGSPGAARAVGNIMARNTIPLVIPCHRVTAAQGRLGGYSSLLGVDMKRRLLDLEAAVAGLHSKTPGARTASSRSTRKSSRV
jgi:methylated-DNA-[protein]-cysteine S-methyltransferase